MEEILQFWVEEEYAGERLDVYLARQADAFSRSFLQKLIAQGKVTREGTTVRAKDKVREGDRVVVQVPEPQALKVEPENIPLDILYEDEDVLVVNKPKGMVVHPAAGHASQTLVNAVLYHCQGHLSGINGILRPGIVHRIDRDTTGALVVCKTDLAHHSLADQLRAHSITRRYRALAAGYLREDGTVDAPLGRHPLERKRMAVRRDGGGKEAVTHYRVLQAFPQASYVECRLETGRTHQIRVHMASIGHPLLGDPVYGNGKNPWHLEGQALHAMVLGFVHPRTKEYMEFTAPLPAYFSKLLAKFGGVD